MVNAEFCRIFGYDEAEILGRPLDDLVIRTPQMALHSGSLWSGILENDRILAEAPRSRKDGSLIFVSIMGVPLNLGASDRGSFWIYRDISRQKETENELCRAAEALSQSVGKLDRLLEQTIGLLSMTIEKRDPYTVGHQKKVAQLAGEIAAQMKLPDDQVDQVILAALVHDIGKVEVPSEILSKPGSLSPLELQLIRTHPEAGRRILSGLQTPWPLAEIIFQHHERLDGSGYPQGLSGDAILLEARIIAVADVVEAMTSHRPYRPAWQSEAVAAEMIRQRGTAFDADVVDAWLEIH